jgi:SAM-dependent methyltransferase
MKGFASKPASPGQTAAARRTDHSESPSPRVWPSPPTEQVIRMSFDYKKPLTKRQLANAGHRSRIGRWWIGQLQLDFMKNQGLDPGSYLLDVGCGPLRAGSRFVDYLDPGHYFGIDINESVLDAGYAKELSPAKRAKLPRTNLRQSDRFECDFGMPVDFAIANSVFSHVSLNHIRLALHQISKVMKPGGRFYATFYEAPADLPLDAVIGDKRPRYQEQNAYWYYPTDLEWAASFGPWHYRYIGEWGHPKQNMVEFTRTDLPEAKDA